MRYSARYWSIFAIVSALVCTPAVLVSPVHAEPLAYCVDAFWINNGGQFQVTNRCSEAASIYLMSGGGSCSSGCRKTLDAYGGYYIFSRDTMVAGWTRVASCSSYETPVFTDSSYDRFRCN
jgi:hypothetical protein